MTAIGVRSAFLAVWVSRRRPITLSSCRMVERRTTWAICRLRARSVTRRSRGVGSDLVRIGSHGDLE